ncbi:sentrin-specific protease 6-like isoform X2 [Mya arenaria]|uniref:sentrin-specific protease 6-like isoform X2 n=1 Tax=Mya arenaria TaxID=6604 RepID=UPI0022DEF3F1|nr:sentrin-specific protease 6-like isoform X2 [Mya arenaria]
MSLVPALEESEKSAGHGWSNTSQFNLEGQNNSNIYQHLISQNNTGNVPEALVEEEIVNELGQESAGGVSQGQVHSPQQQQQQQHQQQQQVYNHQQPKPNMYHHIQQQKQHSFQQQQQQQHFLPQQQQHIRQQQQQQHNHHQKQIHQEQLRSLLLQHTQTQKMSVQSQQQQQQQSLVSVAVASQQKNALPQQANSQQSVHGQQLMIQNRLQYVNNSKINQEDEMDRQFIENQRKIDENNKKIQQLGLQTVQNTQKVNPQPPVLKVNDFGGNGQKHQQVSNALQNYQNNHPGNVNISIQEPIDSLHQNSQTPQQQYQNRTVIMQGPRQNTLQNNTTSSKMLYRSPSLQPMGMNQQVHHPTSNIKQSPVQVSSISTNQNQTLTSPLSSKIDKNNVVLEGGGQFEEGQAYMIRDRQGNARKMIWTKGEFMPMQEPDKSIQHPNIDSSQQKRGGKTGRGCNRGAARGRGQGPGGRGQQFGGQPTQLVSIPGQRPLQGNATGMNMAPVQRMIIRDQNMADVRQQMQQAFPAIQTQPVVQAMVQFQQPRAPVLNKTSLLNLMPAQVTPGKPTSTSEPDNPPVTPSVDNEPENKTEAVSENKELAPVDPPNVPDDPTAMAICQWCGTKSQDQHKCESCKRRFTSATKYVLLKKTSNNGTQESDAKRRKIDKVIVCEQGGFDKKNFYRTKIREQNAVYVQVLNVNTVRGGRGMRLGRGVGKGPRGRGRGRGLQGPPETVTISSDEEEMGGSESPGTPLQQRSAPATPVFNPARSPSHADQQDSPDTPLIPNIPISTRPDLLKGRVGKMETMDGCSRPVREKSPSPTELMLQARTVRAGSLKGSPVEPILISKNGLNFFIESVKGSHRFTIHPMEIQQCLARFAEKTSLIFLLTTAACGARTRRDLGIPDWTNPNQNPPEPYFEPTSKNMFHQMVTIFLDKIDVDTQVEFQRYMELFKSHGKQGDEGFFMELSEEEAEDVFKQTLQNAATVPQGQMRVIGMAQVTDHGYSQPDEENSRSPSPPKIGFVGPVVRLLTYPPPPEKGGISITNEDLYCLHEGEFLNDVIIDFYLKYLLLERLSPEDRARTHIFSSFFYKRLTQRIRGAAIDDDPNLSLQVKRHARVKTWTRHVDLFKKDFIVIPINEHAHWFLAIICFPGLEGPVENRYVPSAVGSPPLDLPNVPTPPQPTDENLEDMEEENEDGGQPAPDTTQAMEGDNTVSSSDTVTPDSASSQDGQPDPTPTQSSTDSDRQEEDQSQGNEEKPEGEKTVSGEEEEEEGEAETTAPASQPDKTDKTDKPPKLTLRPVKNIRGKPYVEGDGTEEVFTGIKQPCVLIFDSLAGPSRSRIVQTLKDYLMVEHQVKKEKELNRQAFKGCVPKVPQQNNFSDCGVYMLQYVESFFEDPVQDYNTPLKGLHDWFRGPKIDNKRVELQDLVIALKTKYETKAEGDKS